jgi:hypothetical protein
MDTFSKALASVFMWLTYLAMVYFSLDQLGGWSMLMAFILMLPLMGGMAFMWTTQQNSKPVVQIHTSDSEKRKRERLDSVLRDLSDEDLMRLKERLMDGTVDDEVLYDRIVGDDGELQYKRQKK